MRFIQCHDFNLGRCKTTKLYLSKQIQKHRKNKHLLTSRNKFPCIVWNSSLWWLYCSCAKSLHEPIVHVENHAEKSL